MSQSKDQYPSEIRRTKESVLNGPGETPAGMRQAAEALAAALSGAERDPQMQLPAELEAFVRKVTLEPYAVTKEDIRALKNAGYSEDAIYELTVSAAVGAGLARLEKGFALVEGDDQ